jgi:hypothetical protein
MGTGATVGVKYPGYRRSLVTTQNYGYDQFPPAANGWGTIHHILDKAPPLQPKGKGLPT